jgi:hypothetical protein
MITSTAWPELAGASSGKVAAATRVSNVATWGGLAAERIVNMCISALGTIALARLPPLETCALRRIPAALGATLRSLLAAFGADPSRCGAAQEVVAEAIPTLTLELCVDLRPKGFVRAVGMIGFESVIDGNVVPN